MALRELLPVAHARHVPGRGLLRREGEEGFAPVGLEGALQGRRCARRGLVPRGFPAQTSRRRQSYAHAPVPDRVPDARRPPGAASASTPSRPRSPSIGPARYRRTDGRGRYPSVRGDHRFPAPGSLAVATAVAEDALDPERAWDDVGSASWPFRPRHGPIRFHADTPPASQSCDASVPFRTDACGNRWVTDLRWHCARRTTIFLPRWRKDI